MSKKVYIAGHCLNRGSQMQRAEEAQLVRELGHDLYVPQENKEINDKANAVQEGLAERIVAHDTNAINWSDTVIIEPDSAALGTHVELGQLLGMKDVAQEVLDILDNENSGDIDYLQHVITVAMLKHLDRKVYPHLEDIRRTDIPEVGDRRSFALNQYVYGACLKLSDGKGLYSMEEITNELSK